MAFILQSNAKNLVIPPPRGQYHSDTIPISGDIPTCFDCTKSISHMKQNIKAREMYYDKPLYYCYFSFYLCLRLVFSSTYEIKKTPEGLYLCVKLLVNGSYFFPVTFFLQRSLARDVLPSWPPATNFRWLCRKFLCACHKATRLETAGASTADMSAHHLKKW